MVNNPNNRSNHSIVNVQSCIHEGFNAFIIESDEVSLVIIPELGAKIVSLVYKPTGKEWLLDQGTRTLERPSDGMWFGDGDMSGWDECFPTIDTCTLEVEGKKIVLPDHGEVWSRPWDCVTDEVSITTSIDGVCFPYQLSRSVSFLSMNQVRMHYRVINTGKESFPFLWVPHPQFQVLEKTRIRLPDSIKKMECVFGGTNLFVGTTYSWAEHDLVTAEPTGDGRKYYAPGVVKEGWCSLLEEESGHFLNLSVDHEYVPYLGVWIDEGMFNDRSAIALEPSIGYYDSLTKAVSNGTAQVVEPGEAFEWHLDLGLGVNR